MHYFWEINANCQQRTIRPFPVFTASLACDVTPISHYIFRSKADRLFCEFSPWANWLCSSSKTKSPLVVSYGRDVQNLRATGTKEQREEGRRYNGQWCELSVIDRDCHQERSCLHISNFTESTPLGAAEAWGLIL